MLLVFVKTVIGVMSCLRDLKKKCLGLFVTFLRDGWKGVRVQIS